MKKKDMSELAQVKIDLRNRTTMYEGQKKRVLELSLETDLRSTFRILKPSSWVDFLKSGLLG